MRIRFFGSTQPAAPVSTSDVPPAPGLSPMAVIETADGPRHDPPLAPRDEAVFLLTAAAEIEHALMVQYLFASYSLNVTGNPALSELQKRLLGIAREEMGHLLTVQNLLHLLGGPLNFNREQAPYASEIYPFRFKLEPVTLDSLAKYVIAESPFEWAVDERQEIEQRALRSNEGVLVRHVGPIFASLQALFKDKLADADFRLDTLNFQGSEANWRRGQPGLIIRTFGGADVATVRQDALTAVIAIAQQGEGQEDEENSHFQRFLTSYQEFKELSDGGTLQLTWPVAENPNTTTVPEQSGSGAPLLEALTEEHERKGRITNPSAKNWAHLFNLRYRLLLTSLSHFLRFDQPLVTAAGQATPRGLLLRWSFGEMRRLSQLAEKLVQLPKDDPPGLLNAGPPFELPYTLNLPERETDRWRTQLDVSKAATALAQRMIQDSEPDDLLRDLVRTDAVEQTVLQTLAAGGTVPAEPLPTPLPAGALSFEADIKGLFRDVDRNAMLDFGFDLHKHQDVSERADDILTRVASGNMPCDAAGRWPDERVAKFRQWIEDGKQA